MILFPFDSPSIAEKGGGWIRDATPKMHANTSGIPGANPPDAFRWRYIIERAPAAPCAASYVECARLLALR